MSSFLAGLVQRGAGLGAGLAVPAMAAPRSHVSEAASFSREVPRQSIDVSPVAPGSRRQIPATAPGQPAAGAAHVPEPASRAASGNPSRVVQVRAAPETPGFPLDPVGARPAPGITPSPHIAPDPATSHVREPAWQPPVPADRPGDVPSIETPAIVIAPLEPQAQAADRSSAPESPRIEVHARDATTMREVSTAATSTSTQVREPPVTVLTAARSARGVESQLPPRAAPAPEPPPIHVRIGKVEVRAPAPAASATAPARQSVAPAPRGFTAYRRLRTYRK